MQEQLNLARYLASFRTLFIPSRARNNVPQRMKKTLPDLECLSIPPVFKRGTSTPRDRNNDS